MKRLTVVGIGCRLMKDDAIGVLVAERIRERLNNCGIDVVVTETDFEFGTDAIRDSDHVIILDAFISGKKPGEITVIPLRAFDATGTGAYTQHENSLLDYASRQCLVMGCLIGIEIADIDYGFELSEQLSLLFENICLNTERIILGELNATAGIATATCRPSPGTPG